MRRRWSGKSRGRSVLGKGKSMCEGPEAAKREALWRHREKFSVRRLVRKKS